MRIKGEIVATFDASQRTQSLSYRHNENVRAEDVQIEFINDQYDPARGIDANLTVDFISIDGTVYQTDDPSVFSTGTWLPEDGIQPGFRKSKTLHTNGFFRF